MLGSDVIAMTTWGGDANLGYGQIDFNVASSGSVFGWFNGDFNYDGKINIDDYGIIDFNVAAQTGTFATGDGVGGSGGGPRAGRWDPDRAGVPRRASPPSPSLARAELSLAGKRAFP